ncbi:MAG TPA: glycosyltransferase family 39 protein [Solirubrobacteraceae bacterium]|nr:glycosyltransferase family 39 protein [Solirubrobacteraceae bacterium]
MRAASRPFALAAGALLLGALALRLWGYKSGLPYVYNADENAHFVPRAIGMFGHSLNPGYFINPPAYTYVLHVLFWLRWGGEGVQDAYAANPGTVFALARATTAVLGVAGVGLLAWAGARLFDRWVGLLAAALLAVAFLPVHYSHLALNDVPALAPLALGLAGAAGVLRTGRTRDFALAGAGVGLAAATKYTAGIVLVPLLAAALLAPLERRRALRDLVLAGAVAAAAFVVANPYALFDLPAFVGGLREQSAASSDGGGKLGLEETHGVLYYLKTVVWGLGWLPALAAVAGAIALLRADRRAAAVLVPAPLLFLAFMGLQDRFFARWLLPVYPILCLIAAWAALRGAAWLAPRLRAPAPALATAAGVLLCAQGLVYSVHNDMVLARDDTRQLAREWMVANVPEGAKVVVEPIAPDQWAMDVGRPSRVTGNGNRWIKWATSRSKVNNDGTIRRGLGRRVKLEDYERTTRPELVGSYARGGFCWVVTGSTQSGRAFAEPDEVPDAIRYYAELERRGDVVHRESPYRDGADPLPFSFDFSFNYYPLRYERPGPEIAIYRLRGDDCGG